MNRGVEQRSRESALKSDGEVYAMDREGEVWFESAGKHRVYFQVACWPARQVLDAEVRFFLLLRQRVFVEALRSEAKFWRNVGGAANMSVNDKESQPKDRTRGCQMQVLKAHVEVESGTPRANNRIPATVFEVPTHEETEDERESRTSNTSRTMNRWIPPMMFDQDMSV